jgi:hypothetical protein
VHRCSLCVQANIAAREKELQDLQASTKEAMAKTQQLHESNQAYIRDLQKVCVYVGECGWMYVIANDERKLHALSKRATGSSFGSSLSVNVGGRCMIMSLRPSDGKLVRGST